MGSYNIALSGLTAATTAMRTVGNNISNASTEGYHAQRVEFVQADTATDIGNGVEVGGITRLIDTILEEQILSQTSISSQVDKELATLTTMETLFGEFSSEGSLSDLTSDFFNALQDLSLYPEDSTYQLQFVSAADSLCNQFNAISESLDSLKEYTAKEAEIVVDQINALTEEIGNLNLNIKSLTIKDENVNTLLDQRDQLISELSELLDITVTEVEDNVVNIMAGSFQLVSQTTSVPLTFGYATASTIGVAPGGSTSYRTTISGGSLGGLLASYNSLIADVESDLDTLAQGMIDAFNGIHSQGCSSSGSFDSLTGWRVSSTSDALEDLGLSMEDGSFYIRITDSSGDVVRTEIAVDVSVDSLADIVSSINTNTTGITASIVDRKLNIQADSGYTFDFMPAPTVDDATSYTTSTSTPSLSGTFTGTSNDTLTFTVSTASSPATIGNGTVTVTVTDSSGTIASLDLGSGYVAGEEFDLGNGIIVSFGTGTLVDGEAFTVEALADTDTSGLLAAVGVNAFFSGTNAGNIAVLDRFSDDVSQLATALTTDYTDNKNALRLASLSTSDLSDLGNLSITDYYNSMVTLLGQDVEAKETRSENLDNTLENLKDQQSQVSGVDINEQSAELLVYEQMYQAVAQYLNITNETLDMLSSLIG